jgi:hypothetical protein
LGLGKLLKTSFSFCVLGFQNGISQASTPFLLKLTGEQKIKYEDFVCVPGQCGKEPNGRSLLQPFYKNQ